MTRPRKPKKPRQSKPLIERFEGPVTHIPSSLFASRCRRCGRWLHVFEPATWGGRGQGVMHTTPERCATALPSIDLDVSEDPAAVRRDIRRVGRALERAPWTFAKSQPDQPHWWTLREQWRNQALFDAAVYRIKVSGTVIKFRKMSLRKFHYGGHIYWTMEPVRAPAAATMLINRAEYAVAPTEASALSLGAATDR